MLGLGARGPLFDSQEGRNFFHLNLFLRGNEPNGEEQQQQQEFKLFLGIWPMAADKNVKIGSCSFFSNYVHSLTVTRSMSIEM